jgi:UDP-3-O-[3-hydroxymyristoyl] glucosamine N-acyltransferase
MQHDFFIHSTADVSPQAVIGVGNKVKIQNGISVYHGVTLEDGVLCGPHCVFTNDKQPPCAG